MWDQGPFCPRREFDRHDKCRCAEIDMKNAPLTADKL
jgi:hypothetical protein